MAFKRFKPSKLKNPSYAIRIVYVKKAFFSGQIIFRMFFLKADSDSAPLNSGPILFQDLILSGKKLSVGSKIPD